jgi:hypothetical protein
MACSSAMVLPRVSSPALLSTTRSTIGWQTASCTQRMWRMPPDGVAEPMKTASASVAHFRMNGTMVPNWSGWSAARA